MASQQRPYQEGSKNTTTTTQQHQYYNNNKLHKYYNNRYSYNNNNEHKQYNQNNTDRHIIWPPSIKAQEQPRLSMSGAAADLEPKSQPRKPLSQIEFNMARDAMLFEFDMANDAM